MCGGKSSSAPSLMEKPHLPLWSFAEEPDQVGVESVIHAAAGKGVIPCAEAVMGAVFAKDRIAKEALFVWSSTKNKERAIAKKEVLRTIEVVASALAWKRARDIILGDKLVILFVLPRGLDIIGKRGQIE